MRSTGEVLSEVAATFVRHAPVLLDLEDGSTSSLSVTEGHPFYVPAERTYRPVSELPVGTVLRVAGGGKAVLAAVERREGEFEVFNFEVAEQHNYFAGDAAVAVHHGKYSNNHGEAFVYDDNGWDVGSPQSEVNMRVLDGGRSEFGSWENTGGRVELSEPVALAWRVLLVAIVLAVYILAVRGVGHAGETVAVVGAPAVGLLAWLGSAHLRSRVVFVKEEVAIRRPPFLLPTRLSVGEVACEVGREPADEGRVVEISVPGRLQLRWRCASTEESARLVRSIRNLYGGEG